MTAVARPPGGKLPPVLGAVPTGGDTMGEHGAYTERTRQSPPRPRPGSGRQRPYSATNRPASASTAVSAARRARLARHTPQFLHDVSEEESLLPRPLPPGISYVANYTSFEELIDKNILTQEEHEKVHLGMGEVRELYHAKCQDQGLNPNRQREARFMQLVSANCRGTHCVMRENGLGTRSAECLAEILGRNQYYCVLDLSGNRLRDAGAEQLAALLEVNDTLVHLALKSNDIGSMGAEHLARALQTNVTLTSLDLSGLSGINRNHLGTQGARALGDALAINRTLAALNLGANGLGNEGLGHMAQGLERNPTLTDLDLGSNNLGWEACTVLGPLLQTSNIQILNLERNELRDKGATLLAQALRRENEARTDRDGTGGIGAKVRSLNLNYNSVRALGFKWLAEMIAQTRRIQTLKLDGNEPGEMGTELAGAIQENRSLTHLSLCKCELSDHSGQAVGRALEGQGTLTKIELSDNHLGDSGATEFAIALKKNRALRSAELGNNKIGDDGGYEIAAMLSQNSHLQQLSLRQNNVREAGDAIAEKLRHNTALLELDFAYNDFSFKSYSAVAASLQRNNRLWRNQAAPRLLGKIDSLKGDEAALYGTEEEILQEIKRREATQESLVQKKEQIKRLIANLKRNVQILDEESQEKVRERAREEESMAARGDELQREKARVENQKRRADQRVKDEENKIAKIKKEQKKVEEDIKAFLGTEEEEFAPLRKEHKAVEDDFLRAQDELSKASNKLSEVAFEIKQLAPQLGSGAATSPQKDEPVAKGARRPSSRPSSAGQAARRRSKPAKK